MLRSNENLWKGTINFIENENQIVVFSAYVSLTQLKALNEFGNITQLIVRWDEHDLITGYADLSIYPYCQKNDITLLRNPRIHLKAIWNMKNAVLFGSANITGRGIGEKTDFNYELNGIDNSIQLNDNIYLEKIIQASTLVDEESYNSYKNYQETNKIKRPVPVKIKLPKGNNDKFLLSQLPMSQNPMDLYDIASGKINDQSKEVMACAAHDIALYGLDPSKEKTEFMEDLEVSFLGHAFISAFKSVIMESDTQSLRYGAAVKWILANTTSVPTPLSWELKRRQIINVLYDWVVNFDQDFTWSIPGARSQVIFYKVNGSLSK